MILLLGAAGLFSSFSHKHAKILNILWLTWIGLTVFELLFEVRARYLYPPPVLPHHRKALCASSRKKIRITP